MRRAHGFTLIEVVIAAGLLLALSVGATMVLLLTMQTIAHSRHRAMELFLARAKLEQVLSLTWGVRTIDGVTVLLTDAGTEPTERVDYLDLQGQPVASSAARYERRWTITRTGTGPAELLLVQVTVTTFPTRDDRDTIWITGARLRRGG
jgi:type II secretory pathway pseudopilin PulG